MDPNTDPSTPSPRELMQLRLGRFLALAYRHLERAPAPFRLTLTLLRPRLAASLDDEPERVVAIAVWAWAKLPELIGDAVDLEDRARVQAIIERVEQREFGAEVPGAVAPAPDA